MADTTDRPLFEVTLKPHRSLAPQGYRLVMALVALASLVASTPFVVLGYWPVAGFYGLDVVLLFFAFQANFREARHIEHVSVFPFELFLRKVAPSGEAREWRFNPVWTRLVAEEHEEFGVLRMALVSRGETVAVGSFLGPDEKRRLVGSLSRALGQARRGPDYS